jgi:hypothetical protein
VHQIGTAQTAHCRGDEHGNGFIAGNAHPRSLYRLIIVFNRPEYQTDILDDQPPRAEKK